MTKSKSMDATQRLDPVEHITQSIRVLRGHKVLLDAELAGLYGVTTARLNQQVRRNLGRFPQDFMFQLAAAEYSALMLQNATSKNGRGGRRKLPLAFTEHGAIMAATILSSPRAVEMSIYVVRAFVRLRELLASNKELAKRLDELEAHVVRQFGTYDQAIAGILIALVLAISMVNVPAEAAPDPQYNVCIEDGGHAQCTQPIPVGAFSFTLRRWDPTCNSVVIEGWNEPSEGSMYQHTRFLSCGIPSTPDLTPPYSWPPPTYSPPGTQLSTLHIHTMNPGTPPSCGPYSSCFIGTRSQSIGCPTGWDQSTTATINYPYGACYRPAIQPSDDKQTAQKVGDPLDPADGNETAQEIDYPGAGLNSLQFVRTYNFRGTVFGPGQPNRSVGQGWSHTYERRLWLYAGGQIRLLRENGEARVFTPVSGGGYQEYGTAVDRLVATVNGSGVATGWKFTDSGDNTETYDVAGTLQSITYRGGRVVTLTYGGASDPATNAPLVTKVADEFGHELNFTYNTSGQIATMQDPSGGTYTYSYTSGLLTSVTYPDSTTRQYLYNESAQMQGGANIPFALTGIVDESATRYSTITYDSSGHATSSALAGGVNKYSLGIQYTGANTSAINYVTDPLGTFRTYSYSLVAGSARFGGINKLCAYCGDAQSTVGYDTNGNVSSKTDFNGNQTTYLYDAARNLEISRTEAYGSPRARTTATQWDVTWRQPALITEPNRQTAFSYDSMGNVLTKTITDTSVTPNVARTWTYTYNGHGQVLTVDGPRTDLADVTTYTYYTCATGYQCGQLHTVTNTAGQTITYNTYNARGQPLTVTDANGVVTTLTYDARLRLSSRQVGSETTTLEYWPTGLLKKVTLSDSSYLLYSYDGAHRLTQVSDGAGNSVDYTLDAMGNRTAENVYDPSNTLHRTHSRVFNTFNQLSKDVNAAGTAAVTTTFGYDNNGNQSSIAAPLTRNTGNAYDELNRLKQITDPANGTTKFGYDANDNLTSVIDPRNLTTSYTYSGFGDLLTQAGPDTASTSNTYDSAGNLATSTDARAAVATYAYDALNRVTSVGYALSGSTDQTISFTYDAGSNGKGHLTGASDANHSLSWSYDGQGRVTNKTQVVTGVSLSAGYAYTNGNLTTLTTPSGQTVAYGYNANHQVTSVSVNGSTVLNGVTYEPLGPVNGWTWGNGTTASRAYDTDGKITQIASSGTKTYSYDNAFRITGISDTTPGAANWTYGYDALDRITSGTRPSVSRGWTYDANGNRLTETGSSPSTYTIASSSNRITAITGSLARTYGYDAAGNATSYASANVTYNNAGRIKTLTQGGATETLVYNALGQRIEKTGGGGGTVLYEYDEAGHLLGEYGGSGVLIEETVWLGDIPVATLRPSGSTVAIYYVHTDQLNTPRQVTRPSDNGQMWTWVSDPFGTDAANSNPAGLGTFTYNLRFPGQYYDAETGLNYNYYRDYDPATGRYIESDPIGLAGGVNTYAYADESPMDGADPFGLFPFNLPQILHNLKLPTRGDCKEEEKAFCKAKCAPARSLGCYVTIRWKLKGIRGGEPIRSEQRTVNCNCEDLEGCVPAPKKGRQPNWLSPPPFIIPWLNGIPVLP